MLKWTASAQKLTQETTTTSLSISDMSTSAGSGAINTIATMRTPAARRQRAQRRRATIGGNKENIPTYTSTPMVATMRTRNSPLVLAPLTDILNVTPEPINVSLGDSPTHRRSQRRITVEHVYAATLPRYEEEYSPSTATILPSGQHLALRGLLPMGMDPFMRIGAANTRYFNTSPTQAPLTATPLAATSLKRKSLPKKRKLAQEFAELVSQQEKKVATNTNSNPNPNRNHNPNNNTIFSSAKMGDQTLDKLIDAILDSACKEEKKKKSRKSFNLRRRTLLKNQVETINEHLLSPSYAAGDDPASDLSFLLCEPPTGAPLPATPTPPTPLPGTPIPQSILAQMPTPCVECTVNNLSGISTDTASNTFRLETPPVRTLAQKRRRCQQQRPLSGSIASPVKKFKVDPSNYFEIGLALPSIYV